MRMGHKNGSVKGSGHVFLFFRNFLFFFPVRLPKIRQSTFHHGSGCSHVFIGAGIGVSLENGAKAADFCHFDGFDKLITPSRLRGRSHFGVAKVRLQLGDKPIVPQTRPRPPRKSDWLTEAKEPFAARQLDQIHRLKNSKWFRMSSADFAAINFNKRRICSPTEYLCCRAKIMPACDKPRDK